MRDAVIFDIDGTLADLSHRLNHIQGGKRDYAAFFDAMVDDKPIGGTIRLTKLIATHDNAIRAHGVAVIFVSGRPDSHRIPTVEWLHRHGVPVRNSNGLYMRKSGDHRPDEIVKAEILEQIRADGFNPILVIDDRPKVVKMWRSAGLTCLQNEWHGDGFDDPLPVPVGTTLLTLMVGPAGAGKSSFLAGHPFAGHAIHPADFIPGFSPHHVISSDQLRADLCGGDFKCQTRNDEVFAALHELASTRMRHGLPVVVDATNLRRANRLDAVAMAPTGTRVRYVVIDRPLEEKHASAGWRAEVMVKGIPLVDAHHQRFGSQKRNILNGDGLDHVDVVNLIREG